MTDYVPPPESNGGRLWLGYAYRVRLLIDVDPATWERSELRGAVRVTLVGRIV